MNLDEVIRSMETTSGVEKTAAQQTPNPEAQLTAALEKAASAPTASLRNEGNVVGELLKMANQLAGTEKDAELAHMALCGQAFADSAITRFAEFDMLAQQHVKTAATPVVSQPDEDALVKHAAELGYNETMRKAALTQQPQNPEMEKLSEEDIVKIAAETGYQETLEKAAADYQAGQDQALQEVHDLAAQEFLKGAAETEIFLNKLRANGQLAAR